MNDTRNGLCMLRFTREGISWEAGFKRRGAMDVAHEEVLSKLGGAPHGKSVWHTVIDDFGIGHTLDLAAFFMVFFSFADIAQRDLAMKSVQQGVSQVGQQGQGFMPRQ